MLAATPTPPMPDSAVGKHESVRPVVADLVIHHVRLKGRNGLWTCLVNVPNHPGMMLCTPELKRIQ